MIPGQEGKIECRDQREDQREDFAWRRFDQPEVADQKLQPDQPDFYGWKLGQAEDSNRGFAPRQGEVESSRLGLIGRVR
jgi:hypothetical protein